MNPYIYNIILSYCNGYDEIQALIDIIDDDSKVTELHVCYSVKMASRFRNLRVLHLDNRVVDLDPLRGLFLTKLYIYAFDGKGDLSPLRGMPLKNLKIVHFDGDVDPLRGMPLQTLYLGAFNGDIGPLRGMNITDLHMSSFTGDISSLRGMPLRKLSLGSFAKNLDPLRGMPLEELDIFRYTGNIDVLRGMPLKILYYRYGRYESDGLTDLLRGTLLSGEMVKVVTNLNILHMSTRMSALRYST